ncbi:uncharacterized protein C7orf50 homolog isoform X2 [Narcine bancroftii]|uniref:uncharacterized protein C7orf50 homolog isoform X2 n=1 Tax=Narcine bancroftii TaxID=1343680 RepID=UPI003831E8D7
MPKERKRQREAGRRKLATCERQAMGVEPDPSPQQRARTQDIKEKAMEYPVCQGDEKLTAELKRKMERKLKKERKKEERRLLREAGIPVKKKKKPQKPSACDLALKYLTKWSNKHEDWKFQKTRQKWLLQHMYDCDKMSDEYFTLLLGYLEGLKGNARVVTIQKTEALIKECDMTDDPTVVSAEKIERMRQVLQLLS